MDKATEFSAFPTILLIVTLYRLALNVATTRMILSEGHNGAESVSSIVAAFGHFVVGGNYIIGIIVFTILVIVNLIVITNGATRVTEVRARFTLDAMPGKQMAIDADLNAGLIGQDEAQKRREALAQEADFYGTMDGASKFVKGDAIASIIITIVNIIGGFLIGVFQHGLSVQQSAQTFTILTIGDGLVGQIPALIVATATGIITTRAAKASQTNFATDIIKQITNNAKILSVVGFILVLFALVPGLPLSLGFVGLFFVVIAWLISREDLSSMFSSLEGLLRKSKADEKSAESSQNDIDITRHKAERVQKSEEEINKAEEIDINEALKVETLEISLGYQLIKLADVKQNGDLLERIRSIRKKIASDYGFIVPKLRVKDNLSLKPTQYEILLKGIKIGEGEVVPDKFLAIDTGAVIEELEGEPFQEPAFNLSGIWINQEDKEAAITKGYTTIDPATIITTHLAELIKNYAEEFITKDRLKELLDRQAKDYPVLVEEANKIPKSAMLYILRDLLHEKIPIRDMPTILECITDMYGVLSNDLDAIVNRVRSRLARTITDIFKSKDDGKLRILIPSLATEQYMLDRLREQGSSRTLALKHDEVQKLVDTLAEEVLKLHEGNIFEVVLMVNTDLRKPLFKLLEHRLDISILGNAEIDPRTPYEIVGTLDITF